MLKGEAQLMVIVFVAWMAMFFGVAVGVLPPMTLVFGPFLLIFGILAVEVILTLRWYSGRQFLQINIRDNSDVLYRVFHMIDELRPVKKLGEEVAGKLGLDLREGIWYFARFHRGGKKLWFLGYESPFPGVLFFVDSKIEELWDRDSVEPEHISYKIPIFSVSLNGVMIGEYQFEKLVENPRWKQLLLRKPKFETYKEVYPIVITLYNKNVEKKAHSYREKVFNNLPRFHEAISKNLYVWVMDNGMLKITDTEKSYLIKLLEEVERSKKEVEKALIDKGMVVYTSPKYVHPAQLERGVVEKIPSWVLYSLAGIIGLIVLFLIIRLTGG